MPPSLRSLRALPLAAAPLAAMAQPVELRGSFTLLNAVVHQDVREDSASNPQNTALELPTWGFESQWKPEIKLLAGPVTALARPRIRLTYSAAEVSGEKREPRGASSAETSEAFLQWILSDAVTFAYGQQSYSWGATESLTPSNRLFHETAQARTVLYDVRGRNLARLNLSAGRAWSLVLVTEYAEPPEEERPFLAEEPFQTAALAKGEVNWNGGADFLGVVVGGREGGGGWVGEYLSIGLPWPEGLSFYADAAHQRGARAWYPVRRGPVTQLERARQDDDAVQTLGVAGLRYDFEDGATVRAEYIGNSAGYTEDETKLLYAALRSRAPEQLMHLEETATRAAARGLDLPGRRYAYVSMSWPKAFQNADLTLFARTLHSLTDRSSASYASMEYAVGDAGTVFLAASVAAGEDDTELAGFSRSTQVAGYRHAW